ncbi:MAG: hypothetical protein H0U95_18410 [Bacteroidetes bacterium]|nr:hypothetical protein [Bacteroidota bacterium]
MGKVEKKQDPCIITSEKFEEAKREESQFTEAYLSALKMIVVPAYKELIKEFTSRAINASTIEAVDVVKSIINEDIKHLKRISPSEILPDQILKIEVPNASSIMYAYVLKGNWPLMVLYVLDNNMSKINVIHFPVDETSMQSFKGTVVGQFIKFNSKYRLW